MSQILAIGDVVKGLLAHKAEKGSASWPPPPPPLKYSGQKPQYEL